MIKTFKCKETEKIFMRESSRKIPHTIQKVSYRKLLMIDSAIDIEDLRIPPANRLEKLSGDREGQYSIRINRQYRICFEYNGGYAQNVEIVDYH